MNLAYLKPIYTSGQSVPTKALTKAVTFILRLFSASEMKKSICARSLYQSTKKREPKSVSIEFRHGGGSDSDDSEPWDTLKAQILVKVDQLLAPKQPSFDDYGVSSYIPRVLPKPGLPPSSEEHFKTLGSQINKPSASTPTVNLNICQKASVESKSILQLTTTGM
ncbi:hypothetical protein L210DRAFT_3650485 [Boletus edulis BED1]|uniref:Uncharacterized protein n=1 Tax=Boletus edulis BED1 TaxID=1328754 RepID=A0AAD4BK55_BOLED|nr:hypothetical protein L210DRAFT_3650485 [Boletus edulis BED1]